MSKLDALRAMDYLGHIAEAIDRIHRYVEDMTELTFLDDEKTQDGKDKLAVNSQNKMDSVQTKTNDRESSIKSSTVNTNTIRGNEPSVMIGADYSNRKVN